MSSKALGSFLATAGAAMALLATGIKFSGIHHIVGVVLSIALVLQPISGVLRPELAHGQVPEPTSARTAWKWTHKVL